MSQEDFSTCSLFVHVLTQKAFLYRLRYVGKVPSSGSVSCFIFPRVLLLSSSLLIIATKARLMGEEKPS